MKYCKIVAAFLMLQSSLWAGSTNQAIVESFHDVRIAYEKALAGCNDNKIRQLLINSQTVWASWVNAQDALYSTIYNDDKQGLYVRIKLYQQRAAALQSMQFPQNIAP